MRGRSPTILLLSLAFMASGCAPVPREAGFDDVQTLVSARSDSRILWNHGTREDPEVSRSVDALLTGELSAEAAVNPALQAEYEDVGVSQADLVQAGLLRNPVLFSTVRFPDRPPSGLILKFEVAQEFLDLLLLPARKRLAADEFERVKLRVAGRVLDIAPGTSRAY